MPQPVESPNAAPPFDIVIVTDIRFPGGTSSSLVEELRAATNGGRSVALLHLRSTRLGPGVPVHSAIRELLEDGTVTQLLPGQPAAARLAIIKHPTVLVAALDGPLPIRVEQAIVVAGQVPADTAGTYYEPAIVQRNVVAALDVAPTWSPISPTVRASLAGMPLTDFDWTEIIEASRWRTKSSQPAHGGAASHEPLVIGRHSRPDRLKWPDRAADLSAAYPTDGSVRVKVLGGADAVAAVLGAIPDSWEVEPFGSRQPAEFLAELDAFVYFHHVDLVEAFGRTVLEALAAGLPVVVPEHFRSTFGASCLYATPQTAIQTARELVSDRAALEEHLARVRRVVDDAYSHAAFRSRLDRLIGAPPAPTPDLDPPRLELAPAGLRRSYSTTMVTCFGLERDEVDDLVRSLDRQRRKAPGFIPVVVHATAKSAVAAELGVETAVVMGRRRWAEKGSGPWEDYAHRRIRQLAAHHRADNIVAADPGHPDAWITLQQRSVPS